MPFTLDILEEKFKINIHIYRVAQEKLHIFEIPYFCSHYRYTHAVFAEVFRNYSRKQQAIIFLSKC